MAKKLLGIDIGYDSLKLVLTKDGQVRKTVIVPMPQHLMREGRIVSPESMGELIRNTLKENGIRCSLAALVLPNESVYLRSVVMPRMSAEQLRYNLPYEFRDYISDELKNYVFDYAMISTPEELLRKTSEDGGDGRSMELMAAAAPVSLIEEARAFLRKAGLKLCKAAPTVSCYQALLRTREKQDGKNAEYCILDLGYQAIRMYMFRGDRHIATRELESGLSMLDPIIAEAENVDEHLAHTYLLQNYKDCQNSPGCHSSYENIAVELMRAINFYRFSNPESQIDDIFLCGGGTRIQPLREAVESAVSMNIHSAAELVPGGDALEACHSLVQAVGITLNEGRR